MNLRLVTLFAALCALNCTAQNQTLRIVFQPDSDRFSDAAHEYESIWAREGARITAAMQAISGLKFEDREVQAIVLEVSSNSGYKDTPMHLRASFGCRNPQPQGKTMVPAMRLFNQLSPMHLGVVQ
jgi:hypothetical protein